jgi:hypothetical protein
MHYALLIREDTSDFAKREDPAEAGPYWASWTAYSQAVAQAGIFVGGAGLMPPQAATTVRVDNGRHDVQDGPFADAKEQLAGFFVINVDDLDAALAWAGRAPISSLGSVEVRPVLPPPPQG